MSQTFNPKTWAVLFAAGLLGSTAAFATPAESTLEASAAIQQAKGTCNGMVVDTEGEPLIGATVRVEGTTNATMTDIDGNFSLSNVASGAKITVTYVGYAPQTVTWKGGQLTVTLKEDSKTLDEYVVMGYGVTQKRAKVTNSVAKVEEKALTVGMNANPAQALAGAVSGVKVSITTGDPGATPNITVRGGTNWNNANNNPLVVVDGQIRGSLSDINPNDIESMEILKDAGATALYGARAGNGVVLVTTKSGKKGTSSVTLSAKYGITHYSSGYDYLNAEDYLYWFRRGLYRTSNPNPEVPGTTWLHNFFGMLENGSQGFSAGNTKLNPNGNWNLLTWTPENNYLLDYGWQKMKDPLNEFRDADHQQDLIFKSTNILKENMRTSTASQDYNVAFQGGNDKGNYYASLGYYDADGALPNTFYRRYNFSFTGGYQIASWLKANSIFNYTRANWQNTSKGVANDYVFGRYASTPPTARITDEEGNPIYGYGGFNLRYQADRFESDYQSDKFQMNQSLTATIIDGLTLKGSMNWYYNEQLTSDFQKDRDSNSSGAQNKTRYTYKSFLRYFEQTYNLVANFNRTFNDDHTVGVMLGMEYYKRTYKDLAASANKAPTDDFGNLQYGDKGKQDPYQASSFEASNYIYKDAQMSYFGRLDYDYQDKYIVGATFREDGYSRLQNNRWGFFPGVSAGWVFSKENFWADKEELSWLNYGKLRASYGMNAIINTSTIGWYTLLGSYSAYQYANNIGFRISGLPNLNLKWERTRTFDIGLTLGFLQNRLNLDLAYYNRLTMDKYANKQLPPTTGFSSVVNNNGSFRNQGVEIDINGTILNTAGVRWTLGANLTYNKNTVVKLPYNRLERNRQDAFEVYSGKGEEKMWVGGLQEGQEPMHLWGFKQSHLLRSWADVEALGDYIDISRTSLASVPIYANESGRQKLEQMGLAGNAVRLSPGDMVWKDRNGDNMIDQYDKFDLGNRLPHWTGGFNTTVSWKGLSLYARFDMGWGFTVYDTNYGWGMCGGQGGFNMFEQVKDTWTPENPNAKLPRWVDAGNMGTDSWCRTSDLIAKSGQYLACREVSLSYEFPKNICNAFRSQGLTLSVTGQNLGYLKKTTLPLPDATAGTNGASGGWGGTYNLPLGVIFGIKVIF